MTEKLLTVSVASYNVERFLEKTLDSCIVPEVMDKLEVLVVNDGSTDSTPQIAASYQERYPETFRLIDKENGGYGSTVNRGILEAQGKYFRLLDGDDWFDQPSLVSVMSALETATEDLIVTSMYRVCDGSDVLEPVADKWAIYNGKSIELGDIETDLDIGMWNMAVRTDLLKTDPLNLPEHILYTDMLFVVKGLLRTKTIRFLPDPLYCYRIGREGQSVSKESRIRNYPQMLTVFRESIETAAAHWDEFTPAEQRVLCTRLRWYHYFAIRVFLLPEKSSEYKREMKEIDAFVQEKLPDVYEETGRRSKKVTLLRLTGYAAYGLLAGKEENW